MLVNLLYNNTDIESGSEISELVSISLQSHDITNILNADDINDLVVYLTKVFCTTPTDFLSGWRFRQNGN